MKFIQNVGKKPINRNKVGTCDNLNWPFPSYMGLTKCCVSFVFKCIYHLNMKLINFRLKEKASVNNSIFESKVLIKATFWCTGILFKSVKE